MKFQKSADILSSKIDDEIILLSIEADSYFGLNEVGSRTLELLDKPASLDELVQQLMQEYDVDEDTCRKDVQSFIDEMLARNLIQAIAE